jgi:hypothetical protein
MSARYKAIVGTIVAIKITGIGGDGGTGAGGDEGGAVDLVPVVGVLIPWTSFDENSSL